MTLTRSEAGLAYVEKTEKGYVVGNPSAGAATVTVTLPGKAAQTFELQGNSVQEMAK
jgi:hypothetical protein